MSIVIKISKPSYDVLTTENKNLTFSSELATHSIFDIVEATINDGQTTTTINHNLGFVPKVWIYKNGSDGDGEFLRRIPYFEDLSSNEYDYHITSSSIVIRRYYSSGNESFLVIIFTRSPNP